MKLLFALIMLASLSAFASQPVGYYNQGSLIDGECMPESGDGFIQLFRDVGNIYGTTEMIDMLERSASEMNKKYPGKDRLQIEDISAREGGDIDPHGSHENGLDVDMQYFKADGVEHIPTPSNPYAPEMVEGSTVSSNFDVERNWELVKALHRNGQVQMIFMDQNLKNAVVAFAKSKGEYSAHTKEINSLRHVENHRDHMHVRLSCPAKALGCHSTTVKKAGGA